VACRGYHRWMDTRVAKGLRTVHSYRTTNSVVPRAAVAGVLVVLSIWFAAGPLFAISTELDGGHATPGHFVRRDVFSQNPHMDASHDGGSAAPAVTRSDRPGHIHSGTVQVTCSVLSPIHNSSQSQMEPPSENAILPAAYDARWQSREQAPEPLPPRAV
jgi:hypothetical protein